MDWGDCRIDFRADFYMRRLGAVAAPSCGHLPSTGNHGPADDPRAALHVDPTLPRYRLIRRPAELWLLLKLRWLAQFFGFAFDIDPLPLQTGRHCRLFLLHFLQRFL